MKRVNLRYTALPQKSESACLSFTPGFSPVLVRREHTNRFNGFLLRLLTQLLLFRGLGELRKKKTVETVPLSFLACDHRAEARCE
jgi:hypothetical protein